MASEVGARKGDAKKICLYIFFKDAILDRAYLALMRRSSAVKPFIGKTSDKEQSNLANFLVY